MTTNSVRIACALALSLASGGALAAGGPAGLTLSTNTLRTDAAGAFISVAVQNTASTTFGQVVVSCTFTGGGRTLGTSSTTLFSLVGGTTGNDQVRLMGATAATAAACEITSAQ
ncbi:hypothetical protein V5F53_00130 [Xanthobacter sp. V4C-4]|uniref:hypothetical protein n=1 Tax=Xanthobacter cornucopiae TaxID=3119924 RepID=UPI003727D8CB